MNGNSGGCVLTCQKCSRKNNTQHTSVSCMINICWYVEFLNPYSAVAEIVWQNKISSMIADAWHLVSPGHQQPWHWLCRINWFLSLRVSKYFRRCGLMKCWHPLTYYFLTLWCSLHINLLKHVKPFVPSGRTWELWMPSEPILMLKSVDEANYFYICLNNFSILIVEKGVKMFS